jgi:hypothetical protein
MNPEETEKTCTTGGEKSTYGAPRLLRFGSLKERTQAGDFFGNDGNTECTGNADAAKEPCIS